MPDRLINKLSTSYLNTMVNFATYNRSYMSELSSIGDRLRDFISSTGLSVAKFAKEVGVPQPTVSSYLNDGREPGITFLMKVKLRYKELNLNWMVSGEGNMKTEMDQKYEELREKYYHVVEEQLDLYRKITELNSK